MTAKVKRDELPAIEGGAPVRETFLPFASPAIGEDEIAEVVDTLRSGWITTGPKVQQFEAEFAAYTGAKCAIAVNSCTAGLHLSLVACQVGPGDEIIVPPLTFGATANVVEHVGARPVFADVDPVTLNIDPERIARAITPRTKAIIPMHFGGLACAMEDIRRLADQHGLAVIEDAAHATGTIYKGRMVGAISKMTSFSFYANKNLTTGEGGMVTTDDDGLAEALRVYRLHGLSRDAWRRYSAKRMIPCQVIYPGYKYNMTDIQASLGIHQLHKQEQFLAIRQRYVQMYDAAFTGLDGVRTQAHPHDETNRHSLHLYVLILDTGKLRVSRDRILDSLLAENIGVSLHYPALHTHPFYREKYGYQPEDFPNAYRIGESILSLPIGPALRVEDIEEVIRGTRKVLDYYGVS